MKVKFVDIFLDETKRGCKIQTNEYSLTGKYPIIDQGQEQIAGYTNWENGIFCDVPVIVFGDHTRIVKYIETPFFLGADGVKVLKSKLCNTDCKYLFYWLSNANIPNTGYNRHFKWLKELEINLPPFDEQKHIVAVLDKVSDLIALRKKQLAKLDELVKARFVEMFGDPIFNEKKWPVKKIKNVSPIVPYKGQFDSKVWLLNLDMVEAQTGRILDYVFVDRKDVGNSTCTFDESNILYSKLRPYLNKVVLPDRNGYATNELLPLKPEKCLNKIFLANLLRGNSFVNFISEKVSGAKMPRVVMKDFNNFDCIVPPLELQQQFADFVEVVDKQRHIIKQSLEKLETLKKSLMQEYFG